MRFDPSRLREAVPPEVVELCRVLRDAGHRGWVVGGCVRDVLRGTGGIGRGPTDWDLATDARPEVVQGLFRRVIPTGLQHGTVTVLQGRGSFEVTTLRGESSYTDGRRPDQVEFVQDLRRDLERRDFTVNAMAYDPLEDRLEDPLGGLGDLSRGLLRAVGEPLDRFREDGLRVLRAARFVATLELELDPATARAIQPSLDVFARVSAERVQQEWVKALGAPRPSRAFELMRVHGILGVTAPEMLAMPGCAQNRYHRHDVWEHTLRVLDAAGPGTALRLAALLHDIAKPASRTWNEEKQDWNFIGHEVLGAEMAEALLERLRFSRSLREQVVALVRHHLIPYDGSWSDAAVRRWLRRVGPERVDDLLALQRADAIGRGTAVEENLARGEALRARVGAALAAQTALSTRDLALKGDELMRELSLPPGPRVGALLAALLEWVTDDPDRNQREALLEQARALAAE
jgi:tRNA nucleotidyltransferase (CCA-adding enzyme)